MDDALDPMDPAAYSEVKSVTLDPVISKITGEVVA